MSNVFTGLFQGPSGGQEFMWGQPPQEYYHPAGRVETMSPEQQALMQQFASWQGGRIGQPGTAYGGAFSPDLSVLQRFATGEYAQPGYLEAKEKELVGTWKEEIMPELRGEMGKKGLFYGSGRERAETQSAESLMDVIARGRVEEERYARQQQLGAAGLVGQFEQAGLTGQYQDWLRTQPENQMGLLMQMLGMQPYEAYGPLQQVLGRQQGAAQGAGETMLGIL